MRVNVSYSVNLEEVLEEVQNMYFREVIKLEDKTRQSKKILDQVYTDKNISEIVISIQNYRDAIASFDLKLTELSGILNGYYNIKHNPAPDVDSQETKEIEQQNE